MKCPDCGWQNLVDADTCAQCSSPLESAAGSGSGRGLTARLAGKVSALKTRKALILAAGMTVAEAVRRMRKAKTSSALITNEGALVGILTEHGILQRFVGLRDASKTRVCEIMETDPVCLKGGDPVAYAFHQLSLGGYRHLVVQLGKGAYGTVSAQDLVEFLV
jgi:signal-transduction protein with cAMP-binding, CBS, and nucleotidyltransferase domain